MKFHENNNNNKQKEMYSLKLLICALMYDRDLSVEGKV